jgi:RHS repeat-associated protein
MTALYNSAASRETLQAAMNAATTDSRSVSYNVPYAIDLIVANHDNRSRYEASSSITFSNNFDSGVDGEFETFLDVNGVQHTIATVVSNPLPDLQQANLYPLTYTFYDGYTFPGAHVALTTDFNKPEKGNNLYEEPIVSTDNMPYGMITGVKSRILGTNDWLTTTIYYNNKGRVIQTLKDNVAGGKDVLTNLYDFNSKLLSSYQRHQNPRSSTTPETTVLTIMNYDLTGRLINITKRLKDNAGLQRTILENTYNELGQIKQRRLGVNGSNVMETQTYDYNVRGWLRGINRGFINAGASTNWLGEELNYDSGFVVNQYNGNIAGTKWKSKTNNIARAYGFLYDGVNQLKVADFSQQNATGSLWTNTAADFTVNGMIYDENGNISHMNQQGMDGSGIFQLDNLSYTYKSNSNKLMRVTDASTVVTKLGDFKNGTNSGDDYDYDANGNLKFDNNKDIETISYNHLNLPETMTIRNKGTIKYLYDASGSKLRKTVTDNTVTPADITITDYSGGFVYQNDSLQFLAHEEGRIRTIYKTGQAPDYKYDYFLKDHLGNVRMVLTEQSDFTMYAASMETAAAHKEKALFSNIDNTRSPKPIGYPVDQTTVQNEFVAKLNAANGGKKIGPSLVLKVMAGDTVRIGAKAFYKSNGPQQNSQPVSVNDMMASLIQAFNGSTNSANVHNTAQSASNSPFLANFTGSDYQHMQQKDPDQQRTDKPKAYLNFVLFDEQFKLVDENSGVKQVQGNPDELQTLAKDNMIIQKSGFLYVYTSNESPQDVFFDNVTVAQTSGPVLEETHYYPFGLTMSGISSNVLKGSNYPKNREEFNGIEHTTDLDLNQYDAFYRNLDPQIGRWWQIDPKVDLFEDYSPYSHVLNNPIGLSDPFGDDTVHVSDLPKVWDEFNTNTDVVRLNGIDVSPTKVTTGWDEYGYGLTFGIGYKAGHSRSPMEEYFGGQRQRGGHVVNRAGYITSDLTTRYIAGMPPDYVDVGGVNLGKNLWKIRNVLGTIKAMKFSKIGRVIVESGDATKVLDKLGPSARKSVEEALELIRHGKAGGNQHVLTGDLKGFNAIDVKGSGKGRGALRIIFNSTEDEIFIHSIQDYH